jgi:hypothetical protein
MRHFGTIWDGSKGGATKDRDVGGVRRCSVRMVRTTAGGERAMLSCTIVTGSVRLGKFVHGAVGGANYSCGRPITRGGAHDLHLFRSPR